MRFLKTFVFPFILLSCCWCACKNNPKVDTVFKGPQPKPPKDYTPTDAELITKNGENRQARFALQGDKIIYISSSRIKHSQAQVYEYHFSSKFEKRLTFQNGQNANPTYTPDGNGFIYASTTDEIKEGTEYVKNVFKRFFPEKETEARDPLFAQNYIWPIGPYEIYLSSLDGSKIQRLTKTIGYDAEVSLSSNTTNIIYTTLKKQTMNSYMMTRTGQPVRLVTTSNQFNAQAQVSPSGKKWAWIHFAQDLLESSLIIQKDVNTKPIVVQFPQRYIWNPQWINETELIFASDLNEAKNLELYTVDSESLCIKRLTYSLGQDFEPSMNVDRTKILFTSNRTGTYQIFIMPYAPPSTCLSFNQ